MDNSDFDMSYQDSGQDMRQLGCVKFKLEEITRQCSVILASEIKAYEAFKLNKLR